MAKRRKIEDKGAVPVSAFLIAVNLSFCRWQQLYLQFHCDFRTIDLVRIFVCQRDKKMKLMWAKPRRKCWSVGNLFAVSWNERQNETGKSSRSTQINGVRTLFSFFVHLVATRLVVFFYSFCWLKGVIFRLKWAKPNRPIVNCQFRLKSCVPKWQLRTQFVCHFHLFGIRFMYVLNTIITSNMHKSYLLRIVVFFFLSFSSLFLAFRDATPHPIETIVRPREKLNEKKNCGNSGQTRNVKQRNEAKRK